MIKLQIRTSKNHPKNVTEKIYSKKFRGGESEPPGPIPDYDPAMDLSLDTTEKKSVKITF